MPADRADYGSRQAALLRALLSGENYPPGFKTDDADAASRSLTAKRARAVRKAWPALSQALGTDFGATFRQYATRTPPPVIGGGHADGLVFARGLSRRQLSDDARAELLLARARTTYRHANPHPRRGLFVGAILLRQPRRLLVVTHAPGLGLRHIALTSPRA